MAKRAHEAQFHNRVSAEGIDICDSRSRLMMAAALAEGFEWLADLGVLCRRVREGVCLNLLTA
jgi:hypothetical protein